jgi:hypothetical protein
MGQHINAVIIIIIILFFSLSIKWYDASADNELSMQHCYVNQSVISFLLMLNIYLIDYSPYSLARYLS